jgi:hypothetical protein
MVWVCADPVPVPVMAVPAAEPQALDPDAKGTVCAESLNSTYAGEFIFGLVGEVIANSTVSPEHVGTAPMADIE